MVENLCEKNNETHNIPIIVPSEQKLFYSPKQRNVIGSWSLHTILSCLYFRIKPKNIYKRKIELSQSQVSATD